VGYHAHLSNLLVVGWQVLEKYEIVELYTGNLGEREMLKNYIISKGAGGADYSCSNKPTYTQSGRRNPRRQYGRHN